jgi:hypothetical protein
MTGGGCMTVPVRLVYSSAPADDAFREQLSTHLLPLVQNRLFTEWSEHHISPGADVAQERHRAWQSADILLLLLIADYFVSDAFDSSEMQQALDRHKSGQLRIVPILLRPFDWQATVSKISHYALVSVPFFARRHTTDA